MAKQRLTRRQQWRIDKVQREREKRALKHREPIKKELSHGELGAEQEGLVIAHYGYQVDVEANNGDLHRCHLRAHLGSIVTGDRVIWRQAIDNTGIIVATTERSSELCRPDSLGHAKAIAANIDLIFLVITFEPRTPYGLIDRYLVASKNIDIHPVILLNKSDLLVDKGAIWAAKIKEIYEPIGYSIINTSTVVKNDIEALKAIMQDNTSIFVGQSGVGKTSLINRLLPHADARVGPLSQASGKGMHTTTTAKLFHLHDGGHIIDSPGIREFGLDHVSYKELMAGFIEFHSYLEHCKFRDCQHLHEPQCGIQAAVEEGKVSKQRFASFHQIRESIK